MALQVQREIEGVNASKYEIELQTVRDQVSVEHKAREQVSADLKALVRFEQLEKQRLEEELTQEKAEGQAQRIALRLQLRELQSALDQVGTRNDDRVENQLY
jgi:archaellum component FlaC